MVRLWLPHWQSAQLAYANTPPPCPALPRPIYPMVPAFPTPSRGFTCPLTSLGHTMADSQPLLCPCPLLTSNSAATPPQLLPQCSLDFYPGPSLSDFTYTPSFNCLWLKSFWHDIQRVLESSGSPRKCLRCGGLLTASHSI